MRRHAVLSIVLCIGLGIGIVPRPAVCGQASEETVFIRGYVRDPEGHPVAGARILLRAKERWHQFVVLTDANGLYERQDVPRGVYQVRIEKSGFVSLETEWDLRDLPPDTTVAERHFTLARASASADTRDASVQEKFQRAYDALKQGDCATALPLAESILTVVDRHPGAHYIAGRCLALQGKYRDAITHYEKVVEMRPNLPEAWFDLGSLYIMEQQWESARTALEKVIALDPSHVDAMYQLARVAYSQHQWDTCLKWVDRVIERDDRYVKAYRLGGYAAAQAGDLHRAATYFKVYLEQAPDAPDRQAVEEIVRMAEKENGNTDS